ncbi:Glutamine amidotransferase domain-containing protein [Alteribacillus persepolensis]|uniref:Glutamine amidotransferase domain-containing protein n=1 Tax=Alteribacillus persepolensis TaxID=568899 RepID=A0A1G8B1L2_9BACI|nr:hypothetical protein [Alteribacillus persepolensis]SDH27149.1 Glutamine amidotransferase domain-containing protein [Alteribacillus persepolensis]
MDSVFVSSCRLSAAVMKDVIHSFHQADEEKNNGVLKHIGLGQDTFTVFSKHSSMQANSSRTLWMIGSFEHEIKEIVLSRFEHVGTAAFHDIQGAFFCIIVDTVNHTFFAARDRHSLAPFYYGQTANGHYLFSTSIFALHHAVRHVYTFPPGHVFARRIGWRSFSPAGDSTVSKLSHEDTVVLLFGDEASYKLVVSCPADKRQTCWAGLISSENNKTVQQAARTLDSQHYTYVYNTAELITSIPNIIYAVEGWNRELIRQAVPYYFALKKAAEVAGTAAVALTDSAMGRIVQKIGASFSLSVKTPFLHGHASPVLLNQSEASILRAHANNVIGEKEFKQIQQQTTCLIRSKEEAWYYQLYHEYMPSNVPDCL